MLRLVALGIDHLVLLILMYLEAGGQHPFFLP